MPTLDNTLKNIVTGDSVSIRRTIDRAASGFESGVTISNAWITFKARKTDADPGLVQKEITTSDVPGTGQIENDGTGTVNPIIRFDLVAADTTAIGTPPRVYDIQVKTNAGLLYTPEMGLTLFSERVTTAT